MLSPNDFKEKQIVFLYANSNTEELIRFKNDNIYIERGPGKNNQISCYKVLALFVIGECTFTTKILQKCQEFGISVFFLNRRFKNTSSLLSSAEGNYLLREQQYKKTDGLMVSRRIVLNKVKNQVKLLEEAGLEVPTSIKSERVHVETLGAGSLETLRGIEGNAAKQFFQLYFADADWRRRAPRSKEDEINLLLDIGYNMLFNFVDSQLALYGFDSYKGFYHQLFFQRKSLVCDLMEPFRCIIDRQIRKSYNLKQFNNDDFKFVDGEFVLPWDAGEKYVRTFANAIMERKMDVYFYIRKHYYCVMNNTTNYPVFDI